MKLLVVCCIAAYLIPSTLSDHCGQGSLLDLLHPSGYSKYIRPNANGDPVEVSVNAYVRSVGPLDLDLNRLSLGLTFRQKFSDPRLAHVGPNDVTLTGDVTEHIWIPDTFFRNAHEETTHGFLTKASFARIETDGTVTVSAKTTLTVLCPGLKQQMEAENKARCELSAASYGYRATDVFYTWKTSDPVMAHTSLPLVGSGFEMGPFETEVSSVKTSTGEYSVVKLVVNVFKKTE